MAIPFIQYLRPDGRRKDVSINRPDNIEEMARKFISAGGWYECEVLSTGEVSLTVCYNLDGEDEDIAIELCKNGPEVNHKVDELVAKSVEFLDAHKG